VSWCALLCSNYHVELNPSDVGSQDRYVVQEVIKELAKNRPLDVAGAHSSLQQALPTGTSGRYKQLSLQ
jgi:hypothetical protein